MATDIDTAEESDENHIGLLFIVNNSDSSALLLSENALPPFDLAVPITLAIDG